MIVTADVVERVQWTIVGGWRSLMTSAASTNETVIPRRLQRPWQMTSDAKWGKDELARRRSVRALIVAANVVERARWTIIGGWQSSERRASAMSIGLSADCSRQCRRASAMDDRQGMRSMKK